MNLDFADALRRRLEPAWPSGEALRYWPSASPAFATLLSTSRNVDRVVQTAQYFFLPFFFFFFAAFAFFAFFAMLPS
jgi:hypothetical protein